MEITSKIPTSTRRGSRIHDANKIGIGTTLAKIMDKKGATEILMENGVPCLSCPMASMEIDKLQIGEVCKMYKLDLNKILKELNGNN